ncbi:uncharacterized protein [Macrobrachium rosenbergii]|uniref:uncharacterized protein n=1 Tax=Macrobrachium rosenbergii TaxID=79674 RepID=UPI0034D686BA
MGKDWVQEKLDEVKAEQEAERIAREKKKMRQNESPEKNERRQKDKKRRQRDEKRRQKELPEKNWRGGRKTRKGGRETRKRGRKNRQRKTRGSRKTRERERQRAHELQIAQTGTSNTPPTSGMSALSQAHAFMPKWTEAEPEVWLDRAEKVLGCYTFSPAKEILEQFKLKHFLLYTPPALATHIGKRATTTLAECCRLANTWDTHHAQNSSMGRKIYPPSFIAGVLLPKNGHLQKPIASYIPGNYDVLLRQDFQSPPKSQQSRGPNSPTHSSGKSNPPSPFPQSIPAPPGYHKDVKFLPVPPDYDIQWPPRSIPDPIPVPSPDPVPVTGPQSDLPPGGSNPNSNSLPVPLACTEQCQAPSVQNGE